MLDIDAIKNWFSQPVFAQRQNYPKYNHVSGNSNFVISVPGIDPAKLSIVNRNRNIIVQNASSKQIYGMISTMDIIEQNEVSAFYRFGQMIVRVSPNPEKLKEYQIKFDIVNSNQPSAVQPEAKQTESPFTFE